MTTDNYKKALDLKPGIVVIMLGSNDAKKEHWKSEN